MLYGFHLDIDELRSSDSRVMYDTLIEKDIRQAIEFLDPFRQLTTFDGRLSLPAFPTFIGDPPSETFLIKKINHTVDCLLPLLRHSELPIVYKWIAMNYIIITLVCLYFLLVYLPHILFEVAFVQHIHFKTQPISLDASTPIRIEPYNSARRFVQLASRLHPYFPNFSSVLKRLELHIHFVAASATECQLSQ